MHSVVKRNQFFHQNIAESSEKQVKKRTWPVFLFKNLIMRKRLLQNENSILFGHVPWLWEHQTPWDNAGCGFAPRICSLIHHCNLFSWKGRQPTSSLACFSATYFKGQTRVRTFLLLQSNDPKDHKKLCWISSKSFLSNVFLNRWYALSSPQHE